MSFRSIPTLAARLVALAVLLSCGDKTTAPLADNPTPGISALSPGEVEQGRPQLGLTVIGSDFVRSSVVRVNGVDRSTEYVSRTELRATLVPSDFMNSGSLQIQVGNPAPGGGTSNTMLLPVIPGVAPGPVISSVSPQFAMAGSAATTVTLTGTGFTGSSIAFVDFTQVATTSVSPTQLRITLSEAQLATARTISLRVATPGATSGSSVAFEIRSPVPVLSSLAENGTQAGLPEFTLRVNGTGFTNASEVRFNGAPRATTRMGNGTLEAKLLEGDLRASGSFNITVSNPTPGGGTSNALPFTLVNGQPQLTLLPSRGATAGRSGFTLYVHGQGFVSGAVVRWNGAPRPTQYISGTRLAATISAADVAQPGTAQITVFNPSPGGGTSTAATMTIRQLGATTSTSSQLTIQARDLAFDPGASRFYLSVVGSVQTYGNNVVAVDPITAGITGSTFVGSEPGKLAMSDDRQYLYVGLNGANAVRRVEIPSLTPSLQWSIGAGLVAGDIGVVPGNPTAVAVSRQSPGISPPLEGVTVYDNGIARPTSSSGHTGGNRIEFLELPHVLYGYNNAHTGFEFFRIGIDAAGARHISANGGLISGFYTDIYGAAGRIYGTDGSIVDAEMRTRIGSFGTGAGAIALDPETGRAYLLNGSTIGVYDLNTFQHLGSITIPNPGFDHPALVSTRLVRWGTDGLAFLDQTRLILVRSPIVGE